MLTYITDRTDCSSPWNQQTLFGRFRTHILLQDSALLRAPYSRRRISSEGDVGYMTTAGPVHQQHPGPVSLKLSIDTTPTHSLYCRHIHVYTSMDCAVHDTNQFYSNHFRGKVIYTQEYRHSVLSYV